VFFFSSFLTPPWPCLFRRATQLSCKQSSPLFTIDGPSPPLYSTSFLNFRYQPSPPCVFFQFAPKAAPSLPLQRFPCIGPRISPVCRHTPSVPSSAPSFFLIGWRACVGCLHQSISLHNAFGRSLFLGRSPFQPFDRLESLSPGVPFPGVRGNFFHLGPFPPCASVFEAAAIVIFAGLFFSL